MSALFFLAKRFVAGEDASTAFEAVRELNRKGLRASLDVLGENVRDRAAAESAVQAYVDLLRRIHESGIDSNISVKLTMTGLDVDGSFCYDNMARVVEEAERLDNFVRIDMEGSAHTQRTLDTFYRLAQRFKQVGPVIQAYLMRSERDIDQLAEMKARVRLCKGAYKEPPSIAYQKMPQIRENFLKLAKKLLQNGNYPAIATHDDSLINAVKQYTAKAGIDKSRFEFQMLYGIRPATQEALAREGYNVRIYVPFGTHWFPYFSRRLRERKENIWFVVKNLFRV